LRQSCGNDEHLAAVGKAGGGADLSWLWLAPQGEMVAGPEAEAKRLRA